MDQKYVSTSVQPAFQQESSHREPHTPQHIVASCCQGHLASAERGAYGQHVVHQNNALAAGDRVPWHGLEHFFQRIQSFPSRGFSQ